tara:strand:+ start:281 stop:628 length:348 start_codon:yes stop_codon:yes gene_type:complete
MKKHDQEHLDKILLRLSLCLVLMLMLVQCGPKNQDILINPDKKKTHTAQSQTVTSTESVINPEGKKTSKPGSTGITDFDSMANILGCMFAPAECQDKKDLASTEDQKGDGNSESK